MLYRTLEILIHLQTSHYVSVGKRVKCQCFRDATFRRRSRCESREISADASASANSKFSVKSSGNTFTLQFHVTPLLQYFLASSFLHVSYNMNRLTLQWWRGGRNCAPRWYPWTYQQDKVLGSEEGVIPSCRQTWLTTIGPLIKITVFFATLSKGQYNKSVFEQLHCDENY